MVEAWRFETGLEQVAVPRRLGRSAARAGVTLSLVKGRVFASVIARQGAGEELSQAARAAFGLALPRGPERVAAGGVAFMGCGPGKWLASSAQAADGAAFEAHLRAALGARASVADLSGGLVLLRISGARARDTLAKGLPLDIDARVFGPGAAACSLFGHVEVQLWRLDDAATFELAVARSLAESLWHALVESAAEYAIEVTG